MAGFGRTSGPGGGLVRTRWCATLLAAVLLTAGSAHAHPESFSVVHVILRQGHANVSVTFNIRDLSRWVLPGTAPVYQDAVISRMKQDGPNLLELTFDDQTLLPTRVDAHSGKPGIVQIDLDYPIPPGASALSVRSMHLGLLPSSHQQMLYVEDARQKPPDASNGVPIADEILQIGQESAVVELSPPAGSSASPAPQPISASVAAKIPHSPAGDSGASFFTLGTWHILAGHDHPLLFLAMLLCVGLPIGQLAVATILLPIIFALKRHFGEQRFSASAGAGVPPASR